MLRATKDDTHISIEYNHDYTLLNIEISCDVQWQGLDKHNIPSMTL